MIEIPLSQGKVSLIDDDDADRVQDYKWTLFFNPRNGKRYAKRGIQCKGKKQQTIYLHRFLMDAPAHLHVDHINGDGLDNRRTNLRLVTPSQNQYNMKRQADTATGFKGVQFDKRKKRYYARITSCGKTYALGGHSTAEAAAHAYDAKAVELFGEFALLNFPHIAAAVAAHIQLAADKQAAH
jgi:hypothetical protein